MVEPLKDKNVGDYVIQLDKLLGSGVYGEVYVGYKKSNPSELVAIKKMELSDKDKVPESVQQKFKALLNNEETVLKKLTNINVIKFLEAKMTANNFYIITELCPDGDLSKLKGNPSIYRILCYFKQIVKGMIYANEKLYWHRDLKPENILLKDGVIKIADFGFAKFKEDPTIKSNNTVLGTPLYMAPEVYDGKYSGKCDVWSAGILLYELIYNKTPWYGNGRPELFQNIKNKDLEFPKEIPVNKNIKKLLSAMLERDDEERIGFEDILKHKALELKEINTAENYFQFLKNLAEYLLGLGEEVYDLKEKLGLDRYTAKQISTLINRLAVSYYENIYQILKKNIIPEEDKIMRKDLNEENLNNLYKIYGKYHEIPKEKFNTLCQELETKKKHFPEKFIKYVLKEDFSLSKKFMNYYKKIFVVILKEFINNKDKISNKETDINVLRLILKINKIREIEKIHEEFEFVVGNEELNNLIFTDFLKELEETSAEKLIKTLKHSFNQLEKEYSEKKK